MVTAKFQAKKEEILHSGLELIWSKGYNGTSVKDIVVAAGIPKGSFYQYFDSKEDFAIQALQAMKDWADSFSMPIMNDKTLSPVERIRKLYEARICKAVDEFHNERGCMFTNITGEIANSNDSLRVMTNRIWTDMMKPLVDTIQAAIDCGELSSEHDANELTGFLEDAFRGAMTSSLAMRSSEPYDGFMKYALGSLLNKN